MIRLKDIYKSYFTEYTSVEVLKGIDLHISDGEFVSIMGTSGSGKSTLLNIIGILDEYDAGEYYLSGTLMQDLSEKKAAYYRNQFIGFVFQSFNLMNFKTALENVTLPLYYRKVDRHLRQEKAMHYLEMVGLADRADHLPTQLSGGQQQRVAIARALVTDPKVILADEPTGALDTKTSDEVMNLFERIHQQGKTILIVTHEREVAERTQRIIEIQDGIILTPEHA